MNRSSFCTSVYSEVDPEAVLKFTSALGSLSQYFEISARGWPRMRCNYFGCEGADSVKWFQGPIRRKLIQACPIHYAWADGICRYEIEHPFPGTEAEVEFWKAYHAV